MCRACGRPFSPWHTVTAPGPTVRHPYRPAECTPDDEPAPVVPENERALVELGARLDAADFAEALAPGGIVESTVDADHPPVGGGCPEAQAGRATIVTTYADILVDIHTRVPNPPSRRGWRRLGWRRR